MPEMSEEDVRKAVEPLILEYFENNDTMEVLFTLQVNCDKLISIVKASPGPPPHVSRF